MERVWGVEEERMGDGGPWEGGCLAVLNESGVSAPSGLPVFSLLPLVGCPVHPLIGPPPRSILLTISLLARCLVPFAASASHPKRQQSGLTSHGEATLQHITHHRATLSPPPPHAPCVKWSIISLVVGQCVAVGPSTRTTRANDCRQHHPFSPW